MTAADRNITIIDDGSTRADIARLYSEEHADVWELLRKMEQAATLLPPMFEVHALVASIGEYTIQSRGRKEIEKGWLALYPQDEERLTKQLPQDTDVLQAIAENGGEIKAEAVTVIRRRAKDEHRPLNPPELIRLMKKKGIGRPSTYANHVANVHRAANHGLVAIDDDDGFHITKEGLALLACLDEDDLPSLDVDYTARFENDLEAIESGVLSAAQVLRIHLAKLPEISIDIPDGSPLELDDAPTSSDISLNLNHRSPQFALPVSIDPEAVLPQEHPFRTIRQSFDYTLQALHGPAAVSRSEASKRSACRTAALAKLLGDCPLIHLIERLRFDLGLRWVVQLQPTDIVSDTGVLNDLVSG